MKLGIEVGVGPDHIVLDGDPAPLKGHTAQPPNFRPMSIVAKLSPISATVEHLFAVANATSENVHRSCKGENGIFFAENLQFYLFSRAVSFHMSLRLERDVLRCIQSIEVADGMAFLHCANPPILHRDLRSANVLLDSAGHAKVARESHNELSIIVITTIK